MQVAEARALPFARGERGLGQVQSVDHGVVVIRSEELLEELLRSECMVPSRREDAFGDDTCLKPHETREIQYDIPAEGSVLVRGELYDNLLWPSLMETFTQLPSKLTVPVLMAAVERSIVPSKSASDEKGVVSRRGGPRREPRPR
jgi:hypothetical protein